MRSEVGRRDYQDSDQIKELQFERRRQGRGGGRSRDPETVEVKENVEIRDS